MATETAVISENMFGDKLYQERARRALPVLVRQAIAGKTIYYQALAAELGIPNPRNLNYVLGSVGQTLIELGNRWNEKIPPIQCLVINQADKMPGEGFGWFLADPDAWRRLSKRERSTQVNAVNAQIKAFPKWHQVLEALNLAPLTEDFSGLIQEASRLRGAGESEEHKALKQFVFDNPRVADVPARPLVAKLEHRIPSGDCIDVFFETADEWVGVEVKPSTSDIPDITRGLFQCVKYHAVLAAMLGVEQKELAARSVLVLGGRLPEALTHLKLLLGVDVVESVDIPATAFPRN